MRSQLLLLPVLSSACVELVWPEELPLQGSEIGACVAPEEGAAEFDVLSQASAGEPFRLMGEVVESGEGATPSPCWEVDDDAFWPSVPRGASPYWLRIRDAASETWIVSIAEGSGTLPATVGDGVTLEYQIDDVVGMGPGRGHVVLCGPQELGGCVWLGIAAGPAGLVGVPAGLRISSGERVDAYRSDCGCWEERAIRIEDSLAVELVRGEGASLGAYYASSGGNFQPVVEPQGCPGRRTWDCSERGPELRVQIAVSGPANSAW